MQILSLRLIYIYAQRYHRPSSRSRSVIITIYVSHPEITQITAYPIPLHTRKFPVRKFRGLYREKITARSACRGGDSRPKHAFASDVTHPATHFSRSPCSARGRLHFIYRCSRRLFYYNYTLRIIIFPIISFPFCVRLN